MSEISSLGAPRVVVHVGTSQDHGGLADALALEPFLAGRQPFARTMHLHLVRPDAPLLPANATVTRTADVYGFKTVLSSGDGWTMRTHRSRDRTVTLTVTAATEELLARILDETTRDVVEPEPPEDEAVTVGFWHLSSCGATRRPRSVAVAPWPDISRNYSRRVSAAMHRLMNVSPETLSGRLLLLHGPPGTGKTTALRALAHAWRAWCRFDYVLDPDRLLENPGYLMEVATGDDGEDDEFDGWRLLILEDCDELIHADAKRRSGQSLARLLNLTDGLLGHGLKLLVGITTNEPLSELHPAVVRPGRCIAQIEVGRLSPSEARAWLGRRRRGAAIDPHGATLAELFALRGELTTVEERAPAAAAGQYL